MRRGFLTAAQVETALRAQRLLGERGQKHKLIGLVMLELGLLGTTELIEILKEISQRAHSTTTASLPVLRIARRSP